MNTELLTPAAKASARLKVALLSRNTEVLKFLREELATQAEFIHLQIWPADVTQLTAMLEREKPDLLLLETSGNSANELSWLESVMAEHHQLAVILLSTQHHPDFLISAMRAGVREVIQIPIEWPVLQRALSRVRERLNWQGKQNHGGKVLAFVPCKGGSGATFLASNLAYAIAAEKKRVCLIDLNLHFGDAALHVTEQVPGLTVVDVAGQIERLDGALLQSSMLKINPYFDLLAAPDSPANAAEVKPERIEQLIAVARLVYDFVVLDLSRTIDANGVKALDCADQIFVVIQPTLPFIRDAARILKIFESLGYPKDKSRLLLNRFDKNSEITLQDIEKTLGRKLLSSIPNSFGVVAESINHGRPMIDLAPRDPVSKALRELAAELSLTRQEHPAWWQRLFVRAAA